MAVRMHMAFLAVPNMIFGQCKASPEGLAIVSSHPASDFMRAVHGAFVCRRCCLLSMRSVSNGMSILHCCVIIGTWNHTPPGLCY